MGIDIGVGGAQCFSILLWVGLYIVVVGVIIGKCGVKWKKLVSGAQDVCGWGLILL